MNTELTERYLQAAIAGLPAPTQDDVRTELTALILDATEARTEQGVDPVEAERAVLTELGDPAILAAEYADRPLQLIGPRFYLTWKRLLILLLWIVPPVALVGVAISQALVGAPLGTLIGESLGVALSAAVHVAFWVTVVFAILERTGARTGMEWDVDQLPELQGSSTSRTDTIASVVLAGLFSAALIWDQLRGAVRLDGESLSVLHPELWPTWILAVVALLALEIALAVVVLIRGRWTAALAALNTALAVAFMSWALTLIGRGELINPEFIDLVLHANGVDAPTVRMIVVILVVAVVATSLWDIVDGWLKVRRDRRP